MQPQTPNNNKSPQTPAANNPVSYQNQPDSNAVPPATYPQYQNPRTHVVNQQTPTNPTMVDKKHRINRETYLASFVLNNIFIPIFFYFIVLGVFIGGAAADFGGGFSLGASLILLLIFIYWMWTFLRACVYRCFDIGISQLWVLLMLIPLVNIPIFFYLCFKSSQPIPNKHGNVPQGLQLKRTLPFVPQ